jgi:hypothetical protein
VAEDHGLEGEVIGFHNDVITDDQLRQYAAVELQRAARFANAAVVPMVVIELAADWYVGYTKWRSAGGECWE